MSGNILAADAAGIGRAVALLRGGGLVAVPTETVYGLAARADSESAVAAIYRAKGRPSFNPLIVHVSGRDAARRLAVFDERADALADSFWPGALTMVVPLRADAGLAAAVTAGLPTVALRCPAHPVMRTVLESSGLALAAPSANRSGGVSPTSAVHVVASLGDRIDAVIDGGECAAGIESTIVALRSDNGWALLRPGPVSRDALAGVLGAGRELAATAAIEAPGQLVSHYSPGKPIRLEARARDEGEFLIGFGAISGDVSLSPGGDLVQAAARLYAVLHLAAAAAAPRIAIAPIPHDGIGAAINDRLRRAAA